MSSENIQKALDSINKVILKICVTFAIAIFIVVVGFSSVIIYNTHKSYDYDYPDMNNTAISGDYNEIGDE